MAPKERLLVVDGYNVLGAWPQLTQGKSLDEARDALIHRLHDYAGYSGQKIVVVFDAWQSDRRMRTVEKQGALTVVFTQRAETADHYIERLCDEAAPKVNAGRMELRVATSDGVEQTVVMGRGAVRLSSRELMYEMNQARASANVAAPKTMAARSTIMDSLPEQVRDRLEKMRRGE